MSICRQRRWSLTAALLCSAVLLAGCTEEEPIESYTVPRLSGGNESTDAEPERTIPGRLLAAVVRQGERVWFFTLRGPNGPVQSQIETFAEFVNSLRFSDGRPAWTLPEGWQETEEPRRSPMSIRFATIRVPTEGQTLELTVMPLPMQEDDFDAYLLQNVNRWRRQLALPPTTREALFANQEKEQEVRRIEVNGLPVTLVNLAGMMETGQKRRPPFAPFASSPDRDSPGRPLGGSEERSTSETPSFEVPEQWKPGRKSALRFAAFEVTEQGKRVEITVIPLPVSGLLANVNRWRRQVGLDEIANEDLKEEVRPIEFDGGTGQYVELTGPAGTILAVQVVRGGRAWFFKLQGDPELAEREKERFQQFVTSVRFQ